MYTLVFRSPRWKAIASMFMLYAGKMSGVLVNLVFIPIYTVSLGTEKFGLVAVILSLQALLMMLDLGLSTLIGRDVAASKLQNEKLFLEILCSERALLIFYSAISIFFLILYFFGVSFGLSILNILLIIWTFFFLVIQNIHYNAILAKRSYNFASTLQLIGNLGRAGSTAYVLYFISPTIIAFVLCQFVGSVIQFFSARILCQKIFEINNRIYFDLKKFVGLKEVKSLLQRSKSLALLALAGAAVTQLDKPIISIFISHSSVAPYFLAMTYCMTPIAILAAPIAQYFQPKIISSISQSDIKDSIKTIKLFTFFLSAIALFPSVILYIYSDFFIKIWLHHGSLANETKNYVKILMPGLAIGALGYIPNSMLLASEKFRFMAVASVIMTVATLVLTLIAASKNSVIVICIVYSCYHACSTFTQWVKILTTKETNSIGKKSSLIAFAMVTLSIIFAIFLSKTIN